MNSIRCSVLSNLPTLCRPRVISDESHFMNAGFNKPPIATNTINRINNPATIIARSISWLISEPLNTHNANGVAINSSKASSTRSPITTAEASPTGTFALWFSICILTASPPAIDGVTDAANRFAITISVASLTPILYPRASVITFIRSPHMK